MSFVLFLFHDTQKAGLQLIFLDASAPKPALELFKRQMVSCLLRVHLPIPPSLYIVRQNSKSCEAAKSFFPKLPGFAADA